ncbi:OmcA/MtrC family decaheme c-type cytochrome [Shewanella maritima]|uniref:OmcA/MtrC family decaheme c-type cytochrome n=1 Tax=Shewanella maritima TaxID=2520507 RepID=UPI003736BEF2
MMKTNYSKLALLLAATGAMTLAGCSGDDGKDGEPGRPGGEPAAEIETLILDVTKVSYENNTPTVEVFATNEEDLAVVGLVDLSIENAAQLIPAGASGAGDSANWQKLGSTSTFVDNKNGTYTFTFDSFDTETFNKDLTQRFNIIAKASTLANGTTIVPVTEIVEDFDGEGYQAIFTKDVVSHEVCTACHAEDQTIYHRATTVETCITCHTQEWAEGRGKPEVAFSHLVHNVHNSNKVWGRNDYTAETAHTLVQDNCQLCHVENEDLAEWGNWTRVPTMEVCTSCHVDIDFKAGTGHPQQQDNSNCVACHNASWTEEIHTSGLAQKKAFIDMYGMSTTLTANKADENDMSATLSVTILDDEGNKVDATSLVSKLARVETITNVGPNFPIMGYNPNPNGLQKVTKDFVLQGALQDDVTIVDGSFQYTIDSLPFGEGDADTAFSFVGFEMCNDGVQAIDCAEEVATTSMKADLAHGTFSGEEPSLRHIDSVNFSTCQNCHGETFELHKGYHAGFIMTEQLGREVDGEMTVGIDGCVTCHTPDGTYASGANLGSIEMKLHKTHASQDIIGDCAQCHNDFNLDAFIMKGALATSPGLYTTPVTATCASCHGVEEIKAHAESQGAIVNGDFTEANQAVELEFCLRCHIPTVENHTLTKF